MRHETRRETRHKTRHETRLEMRHKMKRELLDAPEIILEFSRRLLGGCSVIAANSNARRILQLDSSGSFDLEQHSDETFVFTGWTLHDGFRICAICTMEL